MKTLHSASGWARLSPRLVMALLVAAGCGGGSTGVDAGTEPPPAAADGGTGTDAGTAPSGVPCDVAQVLSTLCISCHSDPPRNSAPMPLVTHAQLTAESAQYPGQSYAARSVARMKAGTMPPGGGASASDIAALESWVNAGAPAGSCGTPDAGTAADAVPDTPPTCTSNSFWTGGDSGSARMHPGVACIACHATHGGAPSFQIAGTVYPTTHEPDDCNGSSSSAITIEITDAKNAVHNLHPNQAGNFTIESPSISKPYKARVLANGKVRAMLTPQTSGDCNACHTQTGLNGAPGRIVAP